jgi:hypothetical protein
MSTNEKELFNISWSGNNYLTITHKDGHEYLFTIDARKIVGDELITPAGAKIKDLDPHQSLLDANKHCAAARTAAENFLKQQFE